MSPGSRRQSHLPLSRPRRSRLRRSRLRRSRLRWRSAATSAWRWACQGPTWPCSTTFRCTAGCTTPRAPSVSGCASARSSGARSTFARAARAQPAARLSARASWTTPSRAGPSSTRARACGTTVTAPEGRRTTVRGARCCPSRLSSSLAASSARCTSRATAPAVRVAALAGAARTRAPSCCVCRRGAEKCPRTTKGWCAGPRARIHWP